MNTQLFENPVISGARLRVSDHALSRGRERLHWSKESIIRMANRVFSCGIAPWAARGLLKSYLGANESAQQNSCSFLYGEIVYVFSQAGANGEVVLLTLYRAPGELLRALASQSKRRRVWATFGSS